MFLVTCEISFCYGHRLQEYDGKCAHLHGHNARVEIEVSSEKLNQQNMVMDFYEIRKAMGSWIDETLDHKMLLDSKDPIGNILAKEGEPVFLMEENPTAEAITRLIFLEARKRRIPVSKVTLYETDTARAVYHE